jgi:hypothetical protein
MRKQKMKKEKKAARWNGSHIGITMLAVFCLIGFAMAVRTNEITASADLNVNSTSGTINFWADTFVPLSSTLTITGDIDTGQGATEVYAMNQDVETSDDVTFHDLTLTGDLTSATSISVKPNSEADDYITFTSDTVNPNINTVGGGNLNLNTDGGVIAFIGPDTSDYGYATTVSNIPYYGLTGGTDLYFRQVGGTWVTVHADAFTEHTNPYNGSVAEAYLDLADWLELKHPRRMGTIHKETNETIGTDVGKAGKANALINIHQKQEINQLKNRLNDIEAFLCGQGQSQFC